MSKDWRVCSKILFYGTGFSATRAYETLKSEGFWEKGKVFVFDRNVSLSQYKYFMGLPVIPREKIGEYLNSDVAVLIASPAVDDIVKHLVEIQSNFLDYNVYVLNSYTGGGPVGYEYLMPSEKLIPYNDVSYRELDRILCDDNSRKILNNIIIYRNHNLDFIRYEDRLGFDLVEDYWDSIKPSKKNNKSIVIDGGAYVGDSIVQICSAINQHVHKYYAFEPGAVAYEQLNSLQKSSEYYDLLVPIMKGLSDSEETISFNEIGTGSSILWNGINSEIPLCAGDICKIQTTTIDALDLEQGYDIYIKLDIEGSEMRALKGAEKLIRERKPNLAICVYHKPNDIVEIPLYLKSLVPDYKIYLTGNAHTICIAKTE